MNTIQLGSVVIVWWLDAAVTPGWHDGDKMKQVGLGIAISTGFLLHQSRKRIVLSMTIDREGDTANVFAIPRANIVRIKTIHKPGAI